MTVFQPKPSIHTKAYKASAGVDFNSDRRRIRRQLTCRLNEKIANFERVAAGLETKGETDAAEVLHQAAHKLKIILRRADR